MGDARNKNDPLDTTMTLGDHLEELRLRVILALLGLGTAVALCLCFGTAIIAFIERPYIEAMGMQARLQSLAPRTGLPAIWKYR